MMDSSRAMATFEMANDVVTVPDVDAIYRYNKEEQQTILREHPWTKDTNYFKNVRISALALLKMVMHARSGGTIEVMGLMQGKIDGDTMIVMDAFALPVEGTETRVSAQQEGYEYMAQYMDHIRKVGRLENAIGWYHSHPGYGCWLSGIDVGTQMQNQKFQEPFLAVVIDPTRTMAAGKVEIGAFRTYPEGHVPPASEPSEYQSIPMNKIEDFGVHANQYYPLSISYFKSSLDRKLLELLWNKYWVNTLSSSPVIANQTYTTGQIGDLAAKMEQANTQITQGSRTGSYVFPDKEFTTKASVISKVSTDATKVASEGLHGLFNEIIRDVVFKGNHISEA